MREIVQVEWRFLRAPWMCKMKFAAILRLFLFAELPCNEFHCGPVAQLDRASVFGTEGWGFEPLRGHHFWSLRKSCGHSLPLDKLKAG
jgi:hypothetical protein